MQFKYHFEPFLLSQEPAEYKATFTGLASPLRNGREGEPLLFHTIGGKTYKCLVDTEAASSLIMKPPFKGSIVLGARDNFMRVGRKIIHVEFTNDMQVDHLFTICPQSPMSLLGRDLLCKLGATINCSPEGLTLEVPKKCTLAMITSNLPKTLPSDLQDLPASLLGWDSTEVGFLKGTVPVKNTG